MLFFSYQFIFVFLPVVLAGFFVLARLSRRLAIPWLTGASLVFYAYWNPRFVALLLASALFNFLVAQRIAATRHERRGRLWLALAIAVDIALLGYFKYADFFITNLNALTATDHALLHVVLPLGISVFTFTQIAFVCDVHRGITSEPRFVNFLLFVSYFPHLIAGPIIHHRQMMPQFDDPANYQPRDDNFLCGLIIFTIGLFKKVVIAGAFAEYSDPLFDGVNRGLDPTFTVAWTATMAYTLQIYFDFSGYSDMAIGISRLFGIRLPENFDSPYKAASIIEFWRRWNMTLSQFLRDYLYIPLGGNRHGPVRRYVNLLVTMILGGLWHGANWTFIVWGALHGGLLAMNHGWRALAARLGKPHAMPGGARVAGVALTFLAVMIAWVFFRASSLATASRMLNGLVSFQDLIALLRLDPSAWGGQFTAFLLPHDAPLYRVALFVLGLALVWLAPNTRELVQRLGSRVGRVGFAALGATCFCITMLAAINASRRVAEFIYFNF